jgi:hypothetical protein
MTEHTRSKINRALLKEFFVIAAICLVIMVPVIYLAQ